MPSNLARPTPAALRRSGPEAVWMLLAALLIVAPASGQCAALPGGVIRYCSESRTLSSESIGNNPVRTDSTGGLGRWNRSVAAPDPAFCDPVPTPSTTSLLCGGGFTDQDTTLGPNTISGSLRATAWDGNEGWGGAASSTLLATFELTSPQTVRIAGSRSVSAASCCGGDGSLPTSSLRLSGPAGVVYQSSFSGGLTTAAPFDFRGRLVPGTYTLSVIAAERFLRVGSNFGGRTAAVVVTLDLCRADFNLSGAVTVQDIFDFLSAYFSNSPAANFNNTGGLSVQDIFDFLGAFFAGC